MHPAARYFSTWLWTYLSKLRLYVIEQMFDSFKLIIFNHNYARNTHTSDGDVTCVSVRLPAALLSKFSCEWNEQIHEWKSGCVIISQYNLCLVLLVFNSDLHLIVLLRYLFVFFSPSQPVTILLQDLGVWLWYLYLPKCITLLSFPLVRFIFNVRIWSEHVMSPLPRCSVYSVHPGEDVLVAPQ